MYTRDKFFIVTGRKIGRKRYRVTSEAFGINAVYRGNINLIEHRIEQECKRRLVFDNTVTYLISPPNKVSMQQPIDERDIIFFIRIPLDEIDIDKIWNNKLKLDARKE